MRHESSTLAVRLLGLALAAGTHGLSGCSASSGAGEDAGRDSASAADAEAHGDADAQDGVPTDAGDGAEADADTGTDAARDGTFTCDENNADWTVGLQLCRDGAFEGYTLFAPIDASVTYLIDMFGRLVHSWHTGFKPGQVVYLLEDGHLLATAISGLSFNAGGAGGIVQELDWDGTVHWKFTYSNTEHRQHHDAVPMPNGHVLFIAWELKSEAEALAAGRDPALLPAAGELWSDSLVEIAPDGAGGATVVWEWHVWDHLVQDFDAGRANHGVVADHPELVNLNSVSGPPTERADWLHVNAVDYDAGLDEVLVSAHNMSEVWLIDHGTTTAEAAGHGGGARGKGGDLLYRWGNPQSYGRGGAADKQLGGQHNASWIDDGLPGAGDILIFNNNAGPSYSSVVEIVPPVDATGAYPLATGEAYGPAAPVWSYTADPPTDFYADRLSGAQRLPNGDTLICVGPAGRFFEIDAAGSIVWEYVNPVAGGIPLVQGQPLSGNVSVFRAYRYPPDYPGLAGRDLTPGGYIELPAD